jgi:HEAT repeat protein
MMQRVSESSVVIGGVVKSALLAGILVWTVAWSAGAAQMPVNEYTRDLRSAEPAVRRQAAVALGRAGDTAVVPTLVQTLKDSQPEVRREVAKSLGMLKDARATGPLIAALADSDANVRTLAAYALGEIRNPQATDALLKALRDTQWNVRDQATWALYVIGDPKIIAPLVTILKEENADTAHIAWLLRQLDAKGTVTPLVALLREKDPKIRLRALQTLGEFKSPEAAQAVADVLKDTDPAVRRAAVEWVGATGGMDARKRLKELAANESDPQTREAAMKFVQSSAKPATPSAWWSFDDRNPKLAKDVTGHGADGEIKGCTVVEGKVGAALRFGEGKYVELGKPTAVNVANQPLTLMAWVKSEAKSGVVVARGGAACGFSLYIKDGLPKFGIRKSQTGPLYLAAGEQPITGDWTHLAGVIDKDHVALFVNGKLAATGKSDGYLRGAGGQGMEIGFDVANSAAEITDNFEGIIDEVKAFAAALTEEEIAEQCGQK